MLNVVNACLAAEAVAIAVLFFRSRRVRKSAIFARDLALDAYSRAATVKADIQRLERLTSDLGERIDLVSTDAQRDRRDVRFQVAVALHKAATHLDSEPLDGYTPEETAASHADVEAGVAAALADKAMCG